jgi:arylamine N-acetyltransferase
LIKVSKSKCSGSRSKIQKLKLEALDLRQIDWQLATGNWQLYNGWMNALADFMGHYRIPSDGTPRQLLGRVATAFAGLPYENITKIIKREESGNSEQARRYPEEVIRDHIHWGTGGTCFSLTSALLHLVRGLGWEAEYILADRRYGQDTHCALIIWIENKPHLLDPGFLITHPTPLPSESEREIKTDFNRLTLALEENSRISLHTVRKNKKVYRLTYRTSPVDTGQFCKAWDASFRWEMMKYPLLTRTVESKQIYMKGSRIQISSADGVEKQNIRLDELTDKIAAEFHIHPALVVRAVSILRDRGDFAPANR